MYCKTKLKEMIAKLAKHSNTSYERKFGIDDENAGNDDP